MSPHTQRLPLLTSAVDLSRSSLTVSFYRGMALTVEVAVFDAAAIASLAGVTSLTLMVKSSREATDAAALMSKAVTSFESCTAPQWLAKTHQHAAFEFTAAECNLDLSGGSKATFWLVFKALLSSGDEAILGTGLATCYEANATAAGDPPENPNPGISVSDADARFVRYDGAQTLTTEQATQALTNLGITLGATAITWPNGKTTWYDSNEA